MRDAHGLVATECWFKGKSYGSDLASASLFGFTLGPVIATLAPVTVETFGHEIAEAMKVYDKHVVCIDKTPEEFQAALSSLLQKAINAYETRKPELRHGIALDRQVTVILSQNDSSRPLCGIYFNLHSPYQKQMTQKAAKPLS